MRLHFPNGEHPDFPLQQGRACLGRSPTLDVMVEAEGVQERHLAIEHDAVRGIVLEVLSPDAMVHVNGRPVRSKSLLRLGDVVVAGRLRFVIRPDSEFREQPPATLRRTDGVPPRVCLRGLSGPYNGRALSLGPNTVLGRDAECTIRLADASAAGRQALIENTHEGIFLRDQSGKSLASLNGVAVRDAVLKPGDQVGFGTDRFFVEAPGYHLADAITDRHQVQHTGVMRALTPIPQPYFEPPTTPTLSSGSAPVAAEEEERHSRAESIVILISALVALAAITLILYLQFFAPRPL